MSLFVLLLVPIIGESTVTGERVVEVEISKPCTRHCYNAYRPCLKQCREDEKGSNETRCYKDCDATVESCYSECPDEEKNARCYWEGEKKFLKEGGTFIKDNCTECTCLDQKVFCGTKICILNCMTSKREGNLVCKNEAEPVCREKCVPFQELKCLNFVYKLRDCCPTCPDKARCLWKKDDRMYVDGERFKEDDCTECTCVNEKIECQTEICEAPAQLNCSNPITREGQCCPVCEDECKKPNCSRIITKAGECCPTCPDEDANADAYANTQLASTATKRHWVAPSSLLLTWAHLLVRQLSRLY